MIWGAINMGFAVLILAATLMGAQSSAIAALLLGIFAFCLFAEGLWLLIAPAPVGVIADGVTLILIGVFNMGIAILSARFSESRSGGLPWFGYVGVVQVILGVRGMARYRLFAPIGAYRPEPPLLRWGDDALKGLARLRPGRDPGCIAFTAGGMPWKAYLGPEFAVAHARGSGFAAVLERAQLVITPKPSRPLAGAQKVTIVLRDRALDGMMAVRHLEWYQAWRSAGRAAPPPTGVAT
jgi:hypothetical protein